MRSYYGRQIVKTPVWRHDIPAYLFSGGLAAGSALLAAGADLTGRPALRRTGRLTALGAIGASTYFLINDLGRPERFHHMLRVAKPTSPMSVGTWILAAFGPAASVAAASEVTGAAPGAGRAAGLAAAGLAPALATYTGVLLANTAVPSWHEAYPQLPFVFAGSALVSAAGAGLLGTAILGSGSSRTGLLRTGLLRPGLLRPGLRRAGLLGADVLGAPADGAGPARRFAVAGAAIEFAASRRLHTRLGLAGEPYRSGRAHLLLRAGATLTAAGVAGATLGRGSRLVSALSGVALLAASALTRFGIFAGGMASTKDPRYTVLPQRERLAARSANDERRAVAAGGEQLPDDRITRDLRGDQQPA